MELLIEKKKKQKWENLEKIITRSLFIFFLNLILLVIILDIDSDIENKRIIKNRFEKFIMNEYPLHWHVFNNDLEKLKVSLNENKVKNL